MQIAGKWVQWTDGETRPMLRVRVAGAGGRPHTEFFLIDTGADRTVFSEQFFRSLQLPVMSGTAGFSLAGISGAGAFIQVDAVLELETVDGQTARVRGPFAAFTDPAATAYSILGRDVLNNFDLITNWRRKEVWLLARNHYYQVLTT